MKTVTYKQAGCEIESDSREAFLSHQKQRLALLKKAGMNKMANKLKKQLPLRPLSQLELQAISFILLKPLIRLSDRRIEKLLLKDGRYGMLSLKIDQYRWTAIDIKRQPLHDFMNIEDFPPPTIDALGAIGQFKKEYPTAELYAYFPERRSPDPLVMAVAGEKQFFVCMWGEEVATPAEAVNVYTAFKEKAKKEVESRGFLEKFSNKIADIFS